MPPIIAPIPNLNNKPLLYYTINQALNSGIFSKIVVSTDSEKIIQLSKKYNAEVFFKNKGLHNGARVIIKWKLKDLNTNF